MAEILETFLAGAAVVVDAISDPLVAAAWDRPSILEEQTVGSLAAHLARGGLWVVAEYLDGGVPEGPATFTSAGHYYATVVTNAGDEEQRAAIRQRGAALAAEGHAAIVAKARDHLEALTPRLRSLDLEQLMTVIGGTTMRVDDYLVRTVVEQVVHLDDLARSVDHEPWGLPPEADRLTFATALEIARRRHGREAVLRGLYRGGHAGGVFPVL